MRQTPRLIVQPPDKITKGYEEKTALKPTAIKAAQSLTWDMH